MESEKSSGENILTKIKKVFSKFNIENIDVIIFVTDRGSNMIEALENNIRLNCSSHLLNNCLEQPFSETTDLLQKSQFAA